MYSLVLYVYMLAVNLAALFGNKKARLMVRGHRNTWRILREKISPDDRPVWFHAASLGEFEQGRVLMERLKREQPERKILLTFFSPSGYEVRKDYEFADVVCYLPFDTMLNARKFLRLAHPAMAIFIKYEFWADYLYQCHRRGVPVYSVSSIFRPSQIFFRWYNCGYGYVLRWVTHFFVQNEASKELLASKGLTNVTVTGDTRLDRVVQIKDNAQPLPLVEKFLGDAPKVFIAGSSWPPDEDVYLPYFAKEKGWKLIIATHEVNEERTEKLRARLAELGLNALTYSALKENALSADSMKSDSMESDLMKSDSVLLIDCFGLLSSIYRYATLAYIGGGFGGGIHNVPEAAVYGLPVVFGPNNHKFQEAQDLLHCGGAFQVETPADFADLMQRLLTKSAEKNGSESHLTPPDATYPAIAAAGRASAAYIVASSGAADKIYRAIFV